MPVPLTDLTGRLKWLSDNSNAKNDEPGPMRIFVLAKGSAQRGDVPFSRAGSRHSSAPFPPSLVITLWDWPQPWASISMDPSHLHGQCPVTFFWVTLVLRWLLTAGVLWAAHTALPQPTLLIVFANCFSLLSLINSVPLTRSDTDNEQQRQEGPASGRSSAGSSL